MLLTGCEEVEESRVLIGTQVLLASGSKPMNLPIEGLDLPGVLTSDGLLGLQHAPESLLIIGGGVIGAEFASVFSSLGIRVTIVEALPRLLANLDKDISQNLKMILKKRGIKIYTGAMVKRIEKTEHGLACVFEEKGEIMCCRPPAGCLKRKSCWDRGQSLPWSGEESQWTPILRHPWRVCTPSET